MQGHKWMPCVCVPSLVRGMKSILPLLCNEAHSSLNNTNLHEMWPSLSLKLQIINPKTTNRYKKKHRFDMEYMPRQTKNLTDVHWVRAIEDGLQSVKAATACGIRDGLKKWHYKLCSLFPIFGVLSYKFELMMANTVSRVLAKSVLLSEKKIDILNVLILL